ncbi:hypothetical protein A9404_03640 [Halothiobacillus diazotrophicus]|uniref:Uncharacterized protein n=1 Tax=Halothiobacillus diazotrophicus TaxID=1860122 RepID=A0A191ZFD7_9GAMM|nr:hypothetical protein A9404_03640 [Halothiobacillus diazotrophicus]
MLNLTGWVQKLRADSTNIWACGMTNQINKPVVFKNYSVIIEQADDIAFRMLCCEIVYGGKVEW